MNRFLVDSPEPAGPVPRVRSGTALAVSAALHGAVVLAAFALAQGREDVMTRSEAETAAVTPVQLIYVPPAPSPAPRPPAPAPPQPARPAAPAAPRVPDNDERAGRPPEAAESRELAIVEAPPAASTTPEPPAAEAGAATTAELMRSEAERIFGRKRRAGAPHGGPTAAPGFELYLPPQPDDCAPAPPRRAGDTVELATVSGRVYRQGTRIPLAGAHLQMIGTPYVTFSDDDGVYDLQFDPALVDRCRTQYVRVTAPGFRAQTLVLYLGPSASNDIPMSQR